MIIADIPSDEAQRVARLHELGVIGRSRDPVIDGLVRCAASLTGCPMGFVSYVDTQSQWFTSQLGLDIASTPRDIALCSHAILGQEPLVVEDTLLDERFHDNPLVTGPMQLRFYAGVPLSVGGQNVGTLCVVDQRPRQIDERQRAQLADLARAAAHWLSNQRTQAELNHVHARFVDFASAGTDWLWECDASLRYTWCSERVRSFTGAGPEAFIGRSLPDGPLLDEFGEPLNPHRRYTDVLRAGRRFDHLIVEREYPAGRFYLDLSAVPRSDARGRLIGWRGIATDATALIAARLIERRRAHILEKLSAHIPGVIYQFQMFPDGRSCFPFASHRIGDIYEVDPQAVRSDASLVYGRIHPDDMDAVTASIEKSARELSTWHHTYRVILPQRGLRVLEGQSSPERLPDGSTLWHGFISDVTEHQAQREAAQAAREREKAAEQTNRDKSLFLSRISHELRTPLNAVLGFTQLMTLDDKSPLPFEQARRVEQVERAGQYLLALINDVLDLGKLGQREPLDLTPVVLRPVIDETLQMLDGFAQQYQVPLRAPLSLDIQGFSVTANARALEQVLANLLSNAIKYNRPGGEARVAVERLGTDLRISVSDDGIGIAPDRLGQLFQPFNRLGAEQSGIEGTGLGLMIVRQLVEDMGSTLKVESQINVGTRFDVVLPLAACAGGATEQRPPADASDAGDHAELLYIEDEPVNAMLVGDALQRFSHWQLTVVGDGDTGLAHARDRQPAVVLTDINLPGMSGLEVVKALRLDPSTRDISCIALSADATPEQIRLALEAGFDDYLTKPLDMRELVGRIAAQLERRRARAEALTH
jgi:signal transduction histidine kinase/ActR/RegA family two-component response regulator